MKQRGTHDSDALASAPATRVNTRRCAIAAVTATSRREIADRRRMQAVRFLTFAALCA